MLGFFPDFKKLRVLWVIQTNQKSNLKLKTTQQKILSRVLSIGYSGYIGSEQKSLPYPVSLLKVRVNPWHLLRAAIIFLVFIFKIYNFF